MSEGYAQVDGNRVWYEEAGDGPAVLLLHAGGIDSRMWDAQWQPFSRQFRVIRFDIPGAGRSPFPQAPFSGTGLCVQLLDQLGAGQAALVGVSAGGGIAIDFVIECPERTWALIAVACGPRGITDIAPDPRSLEVYAALMAGQQDRAAELFLQVWAPLRTTEEVDGRIRQMVDDSLGMLRILPTGLIRLPEWSAEDRLGEIQVPTLAIWGDRDDAGLQAAAERVAERVQGARRLVLPGVDHFVPVRAPEPFNDRALAFLKQVCPS